MQILAATVFSVMVLLVDQPLNSSAVNVTANQKFFSQVSRVVKLDKPGFVFFLPDNATIDSAKKADGEDGFESMVEDHDYYNSNAMDFLEKNKLFYTNAVITDQLEFVKKNGTIVTMNLKKLKRFWGIVLFNGIDDPVIITAINIEAEYKKYFHR